MTVLITRDEEAYIPTFLPCRVEMLRKVRRCEYVRFDLDKIRLYRMDVELPYSSTRPRTQLDWIRFLLEIATFATYRGIEVELKKGYDQRNLPY